MDLNEIERRFGITLKRLSDKLYKYRNGEDEITVVVLQDSVFVSGWLNGRAIAEENGNKIPIKTDLEVGAIETGIKSELL